MTEPIFLLQSGRKYVFKGYEGHCVFIDEVLDNDILDDETIIPVYEPYTYEQFEEANQEYKSFIDFKKYIERIKNNEIEFSKENTIKLSKYNFNHPVLNYLFFEETREIKDFRNHFKSDSGSLFQYLMDERPTTLKYLEGCERGIIDVIRYFHSRNLTRKGYIRAFQCEQLEVLKFYYENEKTELKRTLNLNLFGDVGLKTLNWEIFEWYLELPETNEYFIRMGINPESIGELINGYLDNFNLSWNDYHMSMIHFIEKISEKMRDDSKFENAINIPLIQRIFKKSISLGNIEFAEWIYNYRTPKGEKLEIDFDFSDAINMVSCFKTTKWIMSKSKSPEFLREPTGFQYLFPRKKEDFDFDLVLAVYDMFKPDLKDIVYDIFLNCIRNGSLRAVKWIYEKYIINIHRGNDECFILACSDNRMDIAKWIFSLGDVNIRANGDLAFILACGKCDIEFVQWIYSLDERIDIHSKYEQAFKNACMYGKTENAKWLFGLGANPFIDENTPFILACLNGNLDIAKWIYELPGFGSNIMFFNTSHNIFGNPDFEDDLYDNIIIEDVDEIHSEKGRLGYQHYFSHSVEKTKGLIYQVIMNGHMETSKWIWEKIKEINPEYKILNWNSVFDNLIEGCFYDMAIWLESIIDNVVNLEDYDLYLESYENLPDAEKRFVDWMRSFDW